MSKVRFIGFSTEADDNGNAGHRSTRGNTGIIPPADSGPVSSFPIENGILTIPAGVREIPAEAFRRRADLAAVEFELPCSVREIGEAAFCDCTGLKEVRFPAEASLFEIRADAFRRCEALETVLLPEGVEILGDNSFSECISLTTLHLPSTLKTIGRGAFSLCFRLRHAEIPESVISIGDEAFYLSRNGKKYISLDFGARTDFTGIHPDVLRQSHRCPQCGRPVPKLGRTCSCGAVITR
jgi:hypothetical protein